MAQAMEWDRQITDLVVDLRSTDWMKKGRCVDSATRMFFPVHTHEDGHLKGPDAYSWARTVCRDCPVRLECLSYAIQTNVYYGMWGGMSPRERRNYRRKIRRRLNGR